MMAHDSPASLFFSMNSREIAHRALARRNIPAAVDAFAALLRVLPDDLEALEFLGTTALRAGQAAEAKRLLKRATLQNAHDVSLAENYGASLVLDGQYDAGVDVLAAVLRSNAKFYVARLFAGKALAQQGRRRAALAAYTRALSDARMQGVWTSRETTPQWLTSYVLDAVRYINRSRREWLEELVSPLVRRFGENELRRVRVFIDEYIGPPRRMPRSAQQRPKQHFVPDLSDCPFFDRSLLPWLEAAESATAAIRSELRYVLEDVRAFTPFLKFSSSDEVSAFLASSDASIPHWDAYFFYRHGERFDEHLARCVHTGSLIKQLPLVEIEGFAPEVCFSLLTPGTHILPHTGDSNLRAVFHLPLIIPPHCALRVAGEVHEWREGRGIAFDDTFEHEAWNHSDQPRVVLIADIWNPYLREAERLAMAEIVRTLGKLDADTRDDALQC